VTSEIETQLLDSRARYSSVVDHRTNDQSSVPLTVMSTGDISDYREASEQVDVQRQQHTQTSLDG